MKTVDRYIFRQTLIASVFVTAVLTALVFFMQSLRFIDLVINAGVSGVFIWLQTLLYLPGFFEIILPIGMVAAVLFVYNRLTMDSELIVLRALGFSPMRLARPALILSLIFAVFLFLMMGWVSPASKGEAITLRQQLKAQISTLIFREGVFNEADNGLMVYIRERDSKGRMNGLIIHDSRPEVKIPSTVIAQSGVLVSTRTGQQVLVYNGSRQEVDPKTGILRRLDFDQYTIDLPEPEKVAHVREAGPDEKSIGELIDGIQSSETGESVKKRQFRVELQKRILVPFLVPGFALVGLVFVLMGHHDRRGQAKKVLTAVCCVVFLEILFLGGYNLSKQSPIGFPLMLLAVSVPYIIVAMALFKNTLLQRKNTVVVTL